MKPGKTAHRVAFYVPATRVRFDGIYVSEERYHITFITNEGVTKELRKTTLIHNSHPEERIFTQTLTR